MGSPESPASYCDVRGGRSAALKVRFLASQAGIHWERHMRAKHLLFGLVAGIAVAGCGGSLTNHGIAQIRAISAVTNPTRIDVFTDFNLVASDLVNGEEADYSNQTATFLSIGVRQFGTTQTIASGNLTPGVGQKYTIVPYQAGANAVALAILSDNEPAPAAGKFKIRLTHVDRLVAGVDLYYVDPDADLSEETPVVTNLNYQNATGYVELNAGLAKELVITLAGTTTVVGNEIALTAPDGAFRTLLLLDNGVAGAALNIYID